MGGKWTRKPERYVKRRQKVIMLRRESPEYTSARIASECGLSRERVRQILKEEGLPTRVPNPWVTLRCPECLAYFTKRRRQVRLARQRGQSRFYCSHRCAALRLRQKYLRGGIKWTAKDYQQLWRKRREQGWGAPRLSRWTGIPISTVTKIIKKMLHREQAHAGDT